MAKSKFNYTNILIDTPKQDFFDWTLFLLTLLLVAFGLISIYSATYDAGMSTFFNRQLGFTALGIGVMLGIMYVPEHWIYANALPLYVISLLLLLIVLKFGRTTYGTTGWLPLGIATIQPAEVAKFTTLIMVANHLSKRGTNIGTVRDFFTVAMYVGIPIILVSLQPDIGSASVFAAMFLGILLWSGFDIYWIYFAVCIPFVVIFSLMGRASFLIAVSVYTIIAAFMRQTMPRLIVTVGVIVGIGYFAPMIVEHLAPHQQNRIHTFLNPTDDPRGEGYNVIQSVMAVGSGGVVGKGFLQGTQTQLRYIPAQWTDFIYCVPTEEFGFIGGTLVIFVLFGMLYRMVKIAGIVNKTSSFGGLISAGVAIVFFYHAVINIGMAIGIVPVMGIPLPFMSYGGTSLVVNMAMVGLVLNAWRTHKRKVYNG